MALADKDIIITPNRGQTSEPKIEFRGASASLGSQTITLNVYPTDNGTLSFEGSAGQLFSVTNTLSGSIFSVNDVSGIPSIEVLDTGVIRLAEYSGNVLIGTNVDEGYKLNVNGNIQAKSITFNESDDYIDSTSNVESWVYSKDFSVSGQDTEPRDLFFSSDGTRMFVLGNAGDDVNQYNLSTAWDVGTAVYNSAFVVSAQEATPYGIFFKPDGLAFYIVGANDIVYRYNLGTAWTISTATFANSFSVTAEETDPNALFFSSDGTKMYVMGTIGDDINQYNLSVAWDITTAVYSNVFSIATYETAPQGLSFSADGKKMWIVGSTFNRIVEYNLSIAWNIATATFSGINNLYLIGNYVVSGVSGLFVNEAVGKAWISDYGNDRIFELDIATPATKLHGTRWIVEPDFHIENNLVINRNMRINGNQYGNYGSFANFDVAGTLNVRAALDLADNDILRLGSSDDWEMFHDATTSTNYIDLTVGDLLIRDDATAGDPTRFTFARTTGNFTATGAVQGNTIVSSVATGTAPLSVTSTTRVANLNVATAGASDSTTASTSLDTRNTATTPESFGSLVRFDFKANTTNSLADGGTYNGAMYWRKYGSGTDWSGGGAVEIAYTDNARLWMRYGSSTTWGAWKRVLFGDNFDNGGNVRFTSLGVNTAASGTAGEIRATNEVTAYYSDERLKTLDGKIISALEKVNQLNGYYFYENETAKKLGYSNDKRQIGVSAQEVLKVLPEAVAPAPISEEYLTVKYEKLVPLLIEAIKEQDQKINRLEKLVEQLLKNK